MSNFHYENNCSIIILDKNGRIYNLRLIESDGLSRFTQLFLV